MTDQPTITVLCVDDNTDQLLLQSKILRVKGYRVLEAGTGDEGLALARKADLVVLDVGLPDLSGFEVCKRIKADPATATTPVILLSGNYTSSEDRVEGLEGGGDVYLTKPVEPRELVGQVSALLRVRQAELRAREAARQAEEGRRRLRAVTDHAPVLIAQVNAELRYVFVNRPYAARFGLSPDDLIGMRIPDVLGEEAYRTIAPHVEAALAGRRVEFEAEIPYSNLKPQHMHAAYEPEFDEAGRVYGLVAAITNVSDRVRAEAALRLRDRAIRAVASGVLISDANQRDNPIIYASPGFERLTGYSPEEVAGKNPRLLQGEGTDPQAVAQIQAAVAEGRECLVELLNYKKDGIPFWNQLLISPIRDEQGRLTHFVGVQTDVTEKKKLEQQARQAQKMEAVGQLAGGLAHDLNNLMTVVNGFTDIVLANLSEDDPQRVRLQEIKRAGGRAASLTRQLLAFSQKQILQPKVLDLNDLLGGMEKLLRRAAGGAVAVVLRLGAGLGRIKADPEQICQAVLNLAANAAEAMPDGGTLTVETRNVELSEEQTRAYAEVRPGSYVLLAVSDTGVGMGREAISHLFEPFYTKEAGVGAGLGLAAVHGFVKQCGGDIEVQSQPGKGTTFRLYLPREGGGLDEGKSPAREETPRT